MKNKNNIVSNIKWHMNEDERAAHLFYIMESIRENLNYIEQNLDTENNNDQHRLAQLIIMEEQIVLMADHLSNKNKAYKTV
jgi:Mg2+ and Co2+ transporter CorA